MATMLGRGVLLPAACAALVALGAACTARAPDPGTAPGHPEAGIIVGSFNFPESVLLAHIYADALADAGLPAAARTNLGTREIVAPALMGDLIQVLPEYAGSALAFLSLGQQAATADVMGTHASLAWHAERRGLLAGQPAPAQDSNAIVVTAATAARHRLRTIEDLAAVAPDLVFGGPPECPQRAFCLRGLEGTYGLRFKAFVPLDSGGPLTRQALMAGQVDVGLLFTTDPGIDAGRMVMLADSLGLQPAENVTPLVSRRAVDEYGHRLLDTVDEVSARLTTDVLRALNDRVQVEGVNPRVVAGEWLRSFGPSGAGQAADGPVLDGRAAA